MILFVVFHLFCFVKKGKSQLAKLFRIFKWHKVGDNLKSFVNNATYLAAMTPAGGYKERYEKPIL